MSESYLRASGWIVMTEHNMVHTDAASTGRFALTGPLQPKVRWEADKITLVTRPGVEEYLVEHDAPKIVSRVHDTNLPESHRSWTVWELTSHNAQEAMIEDRPLYVRVTYGRGSDPEYYGVVGCFRLDLNAMLKHGYAKRDSASGVRVDLIPESDGCIYLVGRGGRIPLGHAAKVDQEE